MKSYLENWSALVNEKDPSDFLRTDALWGENQGPDNSSRQYWVSFLSSLVEFKENIQMVLEVGFGSCVDFEIVEKSGLLNTGKLIYSGVEVTGAFYNMAKKLFPKMLIKLTDGETLDYPDKHFDVVYTRHTLEHQENYRAILKEMMRVCKSYMVITFFIPLKDVLFDTNVYDGMWFHNTMSKQMFLDLCYTGGFVVERIENFKTEIVADEILKVYTDQVVILKRKS
jgi:ubiquinone/menaquinone biosynthesis C-methylase UbiE